MFYSDSLYAVGDIAAKKVAYLRASPWGYFVAAMLAGAYVGVGILLVFAIGAPLAGAHSPWKTTVMGASFAVALSLVVFAGSELFTGNNLVLAIGMWLKRTTGMDLVRIWAVSWLGNLAGAMLLALLLHYSGIYNNPDGLALIQQSAGKKMELPVVELLIRGALCNWLVCLAVWMTYRMQTEIGKLVMIFWCLYAFIAAGFEHSVANMTLLTLALLQPHTTAVSWAGLGYNLGWVSLGNAIGGALFVGGAYWLASTEARKGEALSTTW